MDPALEEAYRNKAHELGLTRHQAQELAAYYGAKLRDESLKTGQAFQSRLVDQVKAWQDEVRSDPDYKNILADSRHALAKFGDRDFIKILDESGMGSHPAFINFVRRVGRHLREPGLVEGRSRPARMSFADALWPS